jgi:hypothetical protein
MSIQNLLLFVLTVLSSACAYAIGRTRATSCRSIRQTIETMLECIGASTVFLVFNAILGAAIILLIRTLTTRFVDLYELEDLSLLILSTLQGFVFRLWWRSA